MGCIGGRCNCCRLAGWRSWQPLDERRRRRQSAESVLSELDDESSGLRRDSPRQEPWKTSRACGSCPYRTSSPPAISRTKSVADWLKTHKRTMGTQNPCCSRPAVASDCGSFPWSGTCGSHWKETPEQQLDEQAQKMRDSVRNALIGWAERAGEGSDYTDNSPHQCLHPVGHWYEASKHDAERRSSAPFGSTARFCGI